MPAILLTGRPGSGKTTLIRRLVDSLGVEAGGFYTREVRGRDGRRQGFEIVTLDGQTATLSSVHIAGPQRVGRYGVDLESLERVGVPAIRRAVEAGQLVIIDEVGKMELLSAAFQRVVLEAFRRGSCLLGTVMEAHHPFADELKLQPDVTVLHLSERNREEVQSRALMLVRASLGQLSV